MLLGSTWAQEQCSPQTPTWSQVTVETTSSCTAGLTTGSTGPCCSRSMDLDMAPSSSSSCLIPWPWMTCSPLRSAWPCPRRIPQLPTWPQVAAQSPDAHVAYGNDMAWGNQHGPQLQWDHRPRHGTQHQPGSECPMALAGNTTHSDQHLLGFRVGLCHQHGPRWGPTPQSPTQSLMTTVSWISTQTMAEVGSENHTWPTTAAQA